MCGICGIIGKRDEGIVAEMLKSIRHRGPDEEGIFTDENLTLGMVRLSIIDLSANGHQPMCNSDQTVWIVYNGEMYNFREEKEILEKKGLKFRSVSDTEVVLKMYEAYGVDFLKRIRGMFSLAIFDKRFFKKRVILARDQFGIKPLLYSFSDGIFTFASEMKAMLKCSCVNKELDYEAIKSLLAFGSLTQPYTMLRSIKMLLPAHYLVFENNEIHIERYSKFEIDKYPEIKKMSYTGQLELFKQILSDSVKAHMISDVPIGAFLSGGLDSSLLVAYMAKHSKKVVTFCVGYGHEGKTLDESDAAGNIADYIGTEHHRVEITSVDFKNHLYNIIRALDQPSVDGVNSYFVSQAAKKFASVAISGTGGDEFFIGYPWLFRNYYKFNDKAEHENMNSKLIRGFFNSGFMTRLEDSGFGKLIEFGRHYNDLYFNLASYISVFQQYGARRVLSEEIKMQLDPHKAFVDYLKSIDETSGSGLLQELSILSFRSYTQNQLLRDIDSTSLAHSLEVRVPFIDQEISEFAFSMPDESLINKIPNYSAKQNYNYHQTGIKKMIVDLGKGILPENLDKQSKKGFQMPFSDWLKKDFTDIIDEITDPVSIKRRGLFNSSEIQHIKKAFFEGKESWTKLWLIMVIELWCREFID